MTDTPTIVQALARVMAEVEKVGKGDRNDFHKFMFRGVDRVLNNVGPAFRKHGIVPMPEVLSVESRDVTTSKDKSTREITLTVAYTFHGPAGDSLRCVVAGEAQDSGDKAVSKAMSVAYRTALIQALAIPTGDRDPDSHSYERGSDNLTNLIGQVKAAAQSKGWDVEKLSQEYYAWSAGSDIRAADESALGRFLATIAPPKTVRRQPLATVPTPPDIPSEAS